MPAALDRRVSRRVLEPAREFEKLRQPKSVRPRPAILPSRSATKRHDCSAPIKTLGNHKSARWEAESTASPESGRCQDHSDSVAVPAVNFVTAKVESKRAGRVE